MGTRWLAVWMAALCLWAAPWSVSRADARPTPKDRAHEGLFIRLAAGAGYQTLLAPDRGTDLHVRGSVLSAEASIGLSVERNLILHLTFLYWNMLGENFQTGGTDHAAGGAQAIVVGPGLSYYFMPVNIYISGALGLGFMFMDRPEDLGGSQARDFRSDGGWVLLVAAGKEWWVDEEWSIGGSFFFTLSNFPEPTDQPVWGGPAFGLRLSATFD